MCSILNCDCWCGGGGQCSDFVQRLLYFPICFFQLNNEYICFKSRNKIIFALKRPFTRAIFLSPTLFRWLLVWAFDPTHNYIFAIIMMQATNDNLLSQLEFYLHLKCFVYAPIHLILLLGFSSIQSNLYDFPFICAAFVCFYFRLKIWFSLFVPCICLFVIICVPFPLLVIKFINEAKLHHSIGGGEFSTCASLMYSCWKCAYVNVISLPLSSFLRSRQDTRWIM